MCKRFQLRVFFLLAALAGLPILAAFRSGPPAEANKPQPLDLALSNLPSYEVDIYKVDPYIEAAGKLQQMGRDAACQQLLAFAQKVNESKGLQVRRTEDATAVLCRMLFVKRAGGEFARPGYLGGAAFVGDRNFSFLSSSGSSYTNWPLEPIQLVDGVPFAIVHGYNYHGRWEPGYAEEYVRYCISNCDWSDIRFTAKTEQEKESALQKLIITSKWQRSLDSSDKDYLRQQIR